jgi:nucleotide-binding universal stress UspA family protein
MVNCSVAETDRSGAERVRKEQEMDQNERGGKVVVGVDSSPGSRDAAAWALDEARRRDAELETVFAFTMPTFAYTAGFVPPDPETVELEGNDLIEQALSLVSVGSDIKMHSRVCSGRPEDVLCDVAKEPDVRLLVVGRRGHGDLAELLLGSVSHRLSHHAPTPLVIVPRAEADGLAAPLKNRIVVGVDGSPAADVALDWAAREAQIRGATLEVVVSWSASRAVFPTRFPVGGSLEMTLREAAQELADQAVSKAEVPGLRIEPRVIEGGASSVLIERAKDADLLVVGRRGLNRAQEFLLGSVSHACIHHSPVPIAVIPH